MRILTLTAVTIAAATTLAGPQLSQSSLHAPLPAHATVLSTTPEADSTITELPATFSVTVNEDILQLDSVQTSNIITIQDADGLYYGDGCTTVDGATMSLPAALGAAGSYTMSFQLTSADGHPIGNELNFDWQPAADATASIGHTEAPVGGDDSDAAAGGSSSATAGAASPSSDAQGSDAQGSDAQGSDGQGSDSVDSGFRSLPFLIGGGVIIVGALAVILVAARRRR